MPKVKIVLASENYYDDGEYSRSTIAMGLTDWEEISADDLVFLRRNAYTLRSMKNFPAGMSPIFIVQDEISVIERIETIKDFIEKEKVKEEAAKAKALKAKEEAAAKKLAKKLLKDSVDEKKLYEALAEKYGGENK